MSLMVLIPAIIAVVVVCIGGILYALLWLGSTSPRSSDEPTKPKTTPREELLELEVLFQRDRLAADPNWAPISPAQGLLATEGLEYERALEVAKFQRQAYSLAKGESYSNK